MMKKGAELSKNLIYRYSLWRIWDDSLPFVMFIMLNPSTADAESDDPTIKRCIGFAKNWGFGGLYVCNLFAYRTVSPNILKKKKSEGFDIIGPENKIHLLRCSALCSETIFAWGANDLKMPEHMKQIANYFSNAKCIEKTKKGKPKHPLYLKKDLKPIPWSISMNSLRRK